MAVIVLKNRSIRKELLEGKKNVQDYLRAIEEEESNLDYDDIDESDIDDEYSEYDQYYDDDGK